jgi:pentose-5-phosphate-3-epimerase
MEDKVRAVERLVAEQGNTVTIAVDGGVSPRDIKALRTAGARWFVSGSEIFGGRNGGVSAAIAQMKEAARTDRPQAVGAHRA